MIIKKNKKVNIIFKDKTVDYFLTDADIVIDKNLKVIKDGEILREVPMKDIKKIEISDNKINTPLGKLETKIDNSEEYPAVEVYLGGILISRTEVVNEKAIARTISYNKDNDEPVSIIKF